MKELLVSPRVMISFLVTEIIFWMLTVEGGRDQLLQRQQPSSHQTYVVCCPSSQSIPCQPLLYAQIHVCERPASSSYQWGFFFTIFNSKCCRVEVVPAQSCLLFELLSVNWWQKSTSLWPLERSTCPHHLRAALSSCR